MRLPLNIIAVVFALSPAAFDKACACFGWKSSKGKGQPDEIEFVELGAQPEPTKSGNFLGRAWNWFTGSGGSADPDQQEPTSSNSY